MAESDGSINLAHEPPFRLGEVEVRPATRQLIRAGKSETLEPRVMQVLVVLARAEGAVITRDELIERCWDGRIVGEAAINRVISRIRHIAADFGMDSFQLETITKVGYRMIVDGAETIASAAERLPGSLAPARPGLSLDRRIVLGGAAALALGGAGAWYWQASRSAGTASEAARTLYEKGVEAQRQGVVEQNKQAIAYFRQAVTADPKYADAWGALALAYGDRVADAQASEQAGLAARGRSAAERALALDPDNGDARVALILIRPKHRNWAAIEKDCRRALANGIDHGRLHGTLGSVLMAVGRCTDAIEPYRAQNARDSFSALGHVQLAGAYLGAGRMQEGEDALDSALKLWPNHPELWFTRLHTLTYGGRPAAAIAFATDPESRPYGHPKHSFDLFIASARAIETRAEADIEPVLAARLDAVARGANSPGLAAQLCAGLGRADTAFTLLDAYFFGGGPLAPLRPAPGPYTRRNTAMLFLPPITLLHSDSRFMTLARALGLEDYWRDTGTLPDFRRA